jgi:hypothetical protein
MYVVLMLLAVGLVVCLSGNRNSSLSVAIMGFVRSMDATPLYARSRRRRNP